MSQQEPMVNAFVGQKEKPTDAELAAALGASKPAWDDLVAHMAAEHGATTQEWRCYSIKTGWSVKLMKGKRNLVWIAPCDGCFQAAVILGGKAMAAARAGDPPARLLAVLDKAEKYPEGYGMRLRIRTVKDLAVVKQLAVFKAKY
jgi:hypothetical protein